MSVFKNEDELQDFLKEEIKHTPYCKDVWLRTNLAREKFYSQGRKLFTEDPSDYLYPLAQPEIDFIVRDMNNKLLGIQVKYLKFTTKYRTPRPDKTYYEGIGQTLASLNFGFECVSLWHCFDFEGGWGGALGSIRRYTEATHNLVTTLNLPINYSPLWITKIKGRNEAIHLPYPYTSWHDGKSLKLSPQLPSLYGKENPLRSLDQVKKLNEFLKMRLRILPLED